MLLGLYCSTLSPQYTHFVHSINYFGCKIGIKFDGDPLVVEQNNYATKIVNAYIVYVLDMKSTRQFYVKKLLVWSNKHSKK